MRGGGVGGRWAVRAVLGGGEGSERGVLIDRGGVIRGWC